MMKNGVYLFLIVFLALVGFYAVNALYNDENMFLAGMVFFLLSIVIFFLTTHFKSQVDMVPVQIIINIVYVTLFALYGFTLGIKLIFAPAIEFSVLKFDGGIFLLSSVVLIYGIYEFMKYKVVHHGV